MNQDNTAVPRVLRAAVVLTFFNTWVLFEETIIDRHGLWAYLPYYRYGQVCAWDLGALLLIGWITHRALRRVRGGRRTEP